MRSALHDEVDALLFDLGGVLIRIDWERAFASWAESAGIAIESVRRGFRFDDAYAAHERGEISAAEYFDALRRALDIDLPDAQLLAGWNAIFAGEVAGAGALLSTAAARRPTHLLSNTCEVHREHWELRFAELLRPLSAMFLSCRIGLRKPDPRAFLHVAGALGMAPGRIAFFDDTAENVAGAARAGLRAFHVRSAAELAAAIELTS